MKEYKYINDCCMIKEYSDFIKDSVESLIKSEWSCCHKDYRGLVIVVGWQNGFDPDDDVCIHSPNEPEWCICASVRCEHGYMATDMDLDFMIPYMEDGTCLDCDVAIHQNEDYVNVASYLINCANEIISNYNIDENGLAKKKISN